MVEGDDDFGLQPRTFTVILKGSTHVATGRYVGYLTVVEDDPAPTLTFTADSPVIAEGGSLRFTATLSTPVGADVAYALTLSEVAGRATLSTDDVTPEFLMQWVGEIPDPPRPLWEAVSLYLLIPAGSTTATLEIPTVADELAEGPETLEVTLEAPEDPLLPEPITIAGTVEDR